VKINNRGHLYLGNPKDDDAEGLNSQVIVDVLDNVDLGRSFTIHAVHLSEFAMARDAKTALVAIQNAMPDIPGTAVFIEGTANGENYFKEIWDDPDSPYLKIFVSWLADDLYRLDIKPEDYFELYDIEHEVYGNEVEEREFIIHELTKWYPDEAKDPAWLAHEAMCRLNWRRDYINNKCAKDLFHFRREYPTTPEQAFASSGSTVFNQYKLEEVRQALKETPPPLVRYRYKPDKDGFDPTNFGAFFLFEDLDPSRTYVIGADCAEGIDGGDPSSAVILRCPDLVVAGYYNEVIPPDVYAAVLNRIGRMCNDALMGVEANEEGGYAVNDLLWRVFNYPNLYHRELPDHLKLKRQEKVGWKTTNITKPLMITELRRGITNDDLHIVDADKMELIRQLLGYRKLPDGKLGCARPMHDDLATALAISYQMARRIGTSRVVKKPGIRKWSFEWWAQQADKQNRAN
jgi:hypothetical protein